MVQDYIYSLEPNQQNIAQNLHDYLMSAAGMQDKIRYKIPFYFIHSWICYLNPTKSDGVELAFLRANELLDERGLLDFKGRKQVAGITFQSTQEINYETLEILLQEAILLDETVKYASKRKKK